ncbi:hypothetical protein SO694_000980105 [Aureococcus anophagefferens]|uniref:SGNH hydrolase-type esterase domain-containing protein n=1 Tax=Aureococcus anophagefferens TaxID=44056 RepID=A0ABR1FSZ2_AURAN
MSMRLLAASLVALACVADESCSPWYDEDCIAVVCCGDSITEGADVEAGEDWPSLLQDLLGAQYRVYNKGLSGHTLTATDVEWAASEQGEEAMEITLEANTLWPDTSFINEELPEAVTEVAARNNASALVDLRPLFGGDDPDGSLYATAYTRTRRASR